MLCECKTTDIVIRWYLCLYPSASLDEGSSGASVLSGQVQTLSLQSKHTICDILASISHLVYGYMSPIPHMMLCLWVMQISEK